ncbi:BatD family protein [uncultured Chryseobacterium sp.]|uniref:BatD family protein n=1 Tax=uncultured Chryseobacterium sp. TaxID=259322 RepID=UPI0026317FDE|nr:BatD family protein [uncultured Chryseobacterium sp.]
MKKFIYIFTLVFGVALQAQTLYSNLNKKTLALGEPGVYKIRIDNLGGKDVQAAPKNELLPFHFEEIKDSISKEMDVYERVIEFAVFEEGKYTVPAFEIKVGDQILKTVPYELQVVNTAQKADKINDIMQNKQVKLDVKDYWELYKWYILGLLILLALIFIIWQIIKYGRKRKSEPVVATNQTLKELDKLRKKKFIEGGDFRSFYVELIDITRGFLTKQYHIPADVLLTDDLIAIMKHNNTISQENEKVVEDIFLRGDMVKFAKTFPDQPMMEKDFEDIRNFVKRSSKDLEFEKLRKDV